MYFKARKIIILFFIPSVSTTPWWCSVRCRRHSTKYAICEFGTSWTHVVNISLWSHCAQETRQAVQAQCTAVAHCITTVATETQRCQQQTNIGCCTKIFYGVFMVNFCPIFNKFGVALQNFIEVPNIKAQLNLSCGSRIDTSGWTDRQIDRDRERQMDTLYEANKYFSQLCKCT
jgi:hypothetical protein